MVISHDVIDAIWIKYFIVLISAIGDRYPAYLLLRYFVRKFGLKNKKMVNKEY